MKQMILALATVVLSLSVAEQASAYYAAHLGRFLTRDPLAERIASTVNKSDVVGKQMQREQLSKAPQTFDSEQTKWSNWHATPQQQILNLYQYAGSNPIDRLDPSGLLFGYSYGKYCGFNNRGPGVPIDALDAACKKHDQCLGTVWQFINPINQGCCNAALCADAKKALQSGCAADWAGDPAKQKECEGNAMIVSGAFCALGGQSPLPGQPVANPLPPWVPYPQ